MRTIFKYVVPISDELMIHYLPIDSHIVFTGNDPDSGKPAFWANVDNGEKELEQRLFRVFGTGHYYDDGIYNWEYVGTCIQGAFVWHIFEGMHK